MLDDDVIEHFREAAEGIGTGYQSAKRNYQLLGDLGLPDFSVEALLEVDGDLRVKNPWSEKTKGPPQ